MQTIRKSLLQLIFSGSNMRRWNDKLRPVQLFEVDKQAHKMITAFFLYLLQCRDLSRDDSLALGLEIIEGGLFDYFYRMIITDIKPPVFYRIKENQEHYSQLTEWVLSELQPVLKPVDQGFWDRLCAYHRRPPYSEPTLADSILHAAHLYASKWEFGLIRPLNFFDEELRDIDSSFSEQLYAMKHIAGVSELLSGTGNALVHTANLCGQLRFQIRWSQTPRVPETSVLGHMLVVASYAYFLSLTQNLCEARRLNNFFAGLFHDLPELLTRDIITPVKRSVDKLPDLLHQYEQEELERRVLFRLQEGGYADIRDRLAYYLGWKTNSEFHETIVDESGHVRVLGTFAELHQDCDLNELDPKDGHLIKICDTLAAFVEAHTSIYNGISSPDLYEALARIRTNFRHESLGEFSIGTLLADFN